MLSPARLETYMRRAAALQYETVELPPFVLFFHPDDPLRYFNYARPVEPAGGDLAEPLTALRAAFAARDRLPRFEFVAEFAPALAPALAAAGFVEEARQILLICTPATFCPAPAVPGLEIAQLTADAAVADLQAFATVQRRGFEGDAAAPATEADGERIRRGLAAGTGTFLAWLDGQPVTAGVFTAPLDGLTELAGIATLEAYRSRGIATALTARAVQAAFDRGVEVAFLVAADARAGRVYQRVGFRPYATALAYCEDLGTTIRADRRSIA
jgi:ribosomal protein S18 acetylase RimI-like enzyme